MRWRLAQSLVALRAECNCVAPDRGKSHDGTIGDAAHASRPSSHNPNNDGVVCALDVTHDPAHGMDTYALFEWLRTHPHPNLRYVISNRRVARRKNGFVVERYTGSNAHDKHTHIAVGQGSDSEPTRPYDDTTPWGLAKWKCGPTTKETVWEWMDRVIFKPRDSELTGDVIRQACENYGLKPLWLLTVTGAETSCGRRSDGRIVTEAHNYGCIKFPADRTTKWGQLALPEPLVMADGRRFAKYKDVWTGMAALGRLLKVGPSSDPGLYLRQMKVRDWHGFAFTYYGRNVPGVAEYEANLLKIEAGFKAMAAKAGFQW